MTHDNFFNDGNVVKIIETKKMYAPMTNSDRNEGRGYQYAVAVCKSPITAKRVGRGLGVQGCDCEVEEVLMIKVDCDPRPRWFIGSEAVDILEMTQEDKEVEKLEKMQAAHYAALEKARKLGLSEDDLVAIMYNPTCDD